jgi:hypothetical protein
MIRVYVRQSAHFVTYDAHSWSNAYDRARRGSYFVRIILRTEKSKTLGFLIVQTTIVPRYVAQDRARRNTFGKRPSYRTSEGTWLPDDPVHFRLFFVVYKRRRILRPSDTGLLNRFTVSHFWLSARCETSVDTCVNCATMWFRLSHFGTTGKHQRE